MKLNLGGGDQQIPDFQNVDLGGSGYIHDLSVMPWPFKDGSCEALVASHILEHFTKEQGKQFLKECYRLLKPGGVLALAVPDMDKFITARLTGRYEPLGGYSWIDLNDLLGGGGNEHNTFMRHRYMYTWESLAWALTEVEFTPTRIAFDTSALGLVHNGLYAPISLYVDARKA